MEKLWISGINSVRSLQILYFSKKTKKLKRLTKDEKKFARTLIILYYLLINLVEVVIPSIMHMVKYVFQTK